MPYSINYSDPNKTPIVVNDGTVDTSTPIYLIGKNATRFGEYLNENMLNLAENFASGTAPSDPIDGILWFDTDNNLLKIFNNGEWYTIGFAGTTRIEVRRRLDTTGVYHYTIEHIVDDVIITVTVDDATAWTPAITEFLEDGTTLMSTQFPTIQAGINMNATNADSENHTFKFRGRATSAEYADLAERYAADTPYDEGHVVAIGGRKEITETSAPGDTNVFGVISTRPAFEMNSGAGDSDTHPFVALAGRVPCKVIGTVRKGDRMESSEVPGHARAVRGTDILDYRCIIGRALEDKTTPEAGKIEIVVGTK